MTRIKITDEHDDEKTLFRSRKIHLNGKKITSPIKSIDMSKISSTLDVKQSIRSVNEIFRKLTPEKTTLLMKDADEQKAFDYSINSEINKTKDEEINVFIVEYESQKYPTGKSLEYISDNVHSFSDLVTIPLIEDLSRNLKTEKDFKEYLSFLNAFLGEIRRLNKKPIMGIVPMVPWIYMEDLANFYLKNGVNAFCFDFECKSPLSVGRSLRPFFKVLNDEDLLGNSLLYALNVSTGKMVRASGIAPAKDILSFSIGFDILGQKHKMLRGPKELYEKMKKEEKKFRLFNKDDYGYYSLSLKGQLQKFYPKDSSIPIKTALQIAEKNISRVQSVVNMEQQGLESLILQDKIKNDEVIKHLQAKKNITDVDKKIIFKIRDQIISKAMSLKGFFSK